MFRLYWTCEGAIDANLLAYLEAQDAVHIKDPSEQPLSNWFIRFQQDTDDNITGDSRGVGVWLGRAASGELLTQTSLIDIDLVSAWYEVATPTGFPDPIIDRMCTMVREMGKICSTLGEWDEDEDVILFFYFEHLSAFELLAEVADMSEEGEA